jgi:NAD(P)H-dependent FMN reductase
MPRLFVVTVSTRDGRQGLPIAQWSVERAKAHGKFEVETVDLRELNLPVFDEPEHPRFRKPVHEHTKKWAAMVDRADAFVFVTPEYNYGMPPSLLNAITYLSHEWQYKAAGFVSYGGMSGGTRSTQMARGVLATMKMVPIPEGVAVPFFIKMIADGKFTPGDMQDKGMTAMLDELFKWETALKTLRAPAKP